MDPTLIGGARVCLSEEALVGGAAVRVGVGGVGKDVTRQCDHSERRRSCRARPMMGEMERNEVRHRCEVVVATNQDLTPCLVVSEGKRRTNASTLGARHDSKWKTLGVPGQ